MNRYGEYKKIEAQWLGTIPSHWDSPQLREILKNVKRKFPIKNSLHSLSARQALFRNFPQQPKVMLAITAKQYAKEILSSIAALTDAVPAAFPNMKALFLLSAMFSVHEAM